MLGSRTSVAPHDRLLGALKELRDRAASTRLPLEVIGAPEARADLAALAAQLSDYLLPRLQEPSAPLLTVIGGPTGAGKSTLVNSLVGYPVSRADVLRPTTRAPILVCSATDAEWFRQPHLLPAFTRLAAAPADGQPASGIHIVEGAIPAGLALLDSPDLDSVVAGNRQLAGQLLGAADLWILVTTAVRYADAVPWAHLTVARQRGIALAVLLNRAPASGIDDVTAHLASLLNHHGLGDAPVFVAPETALGPGGLLPAEFVDPIRAWLFGLVADEEQRLGLVQATVEGALDSLRIRLPALAGAAEAQVAGLVALRAQVDDALRAAIRRFRDTTGDGSLLRGDVLTRWNGFAGTGAVMTSALAALLRIRDRFGSALLGKQPPGGAVHSALTMALVALIRSVADAAAERIVDGWRGHPPGSALLQEKDITVGRADDELAGQAAAEIVAWQEHVIELVKPRASGKRWHLRYASLGTAGIATLTMVGAVTHSSAPSDGSAELDAATLSRRLLANVLGDMPAQELIDSARRDLAARIEPLFLGEARRFTDLLESVQVDAALAGWLRAQQAAIEKARGAPR